MEDKKELAMRRRPWRRVSQGKFPGKRVFEKHKVGLDRLEYSGRGRECMKRNQRPGCHYSGSWRPWQRGFLLFVMENQWRILSKGLVWFTFSDPPDYWVGNWLKWAQMKARRPRDGELAPTGLTNPGRGVGVKREQNLVLTFVLIKVKWKGGGFWWRSQAFCFRQCDNGWRHMLRRRKWADISGGSHHHQDAN